MVHRLRFLAPLVALGLGAARTHAGTHEVGGGGRSGGAARQAQSEWVRRGPDGRGEILFQYAGGIRRLDLATGGSQTVPIALPGSERVVNERTVDAGRNIVNVDPSPDGSRIAVEA